MQTKHLKQNSSGTEGSSGNMSLTEALGNKAKARSYFLSLRKQFVSNHKVEMEIKFLSNLFTFLKQQRKLDTIAAYRAKADELNIDGIFQLKNLKLCFPKMNKESLDFYLVNDPKDFEKARFDIWEPNLNCEKVELSEIDLILVPACAFDRKGQRLGWGRGFYDRSLALSKALKVGVGFSCQLIDEELPCDQFDVKMDWIITESEIVEVRKG